MSKRLIREDTSQLKSCPKYFYTTFVTTTVYSTDSGWNVCSMIVSIIQKLALSISPECEHRAIKDGGRVKRFDVSHSLLSHLADSSSSSSSRPPSSSQIKSNQIL